MITLKAGVCKLYSELSNEQYYSLAKDPSVAKTFAGQPPENFRAPYNDNFLCTSHAKEIGLIFGRPSIARGVEIHMSFMRNHISQATLFLELTLLYYRLRGEVPYTVIGAEQQSIHNFLYKRMRAHPVHVNSKGETIYMIPPEWQPKTINNLGIRYA